MKMLVPCVTWLLLRFSLSAAQNSSLTGDSGFTFDCRRGNSDCASNYTCDLTTGKCDCSGLANSNYKCDVPDRTSCFPSCLNGFCNSGKCVCDQSHYGPDCSLDRVQVNCHGPDMFVNINPMDNFNGLIYVQNLTACMPVLNSSGPARAIFNDQISKDIFGWSILFTSNNAGCSAIKSAADGSLTAKVYIQYSKMFKSAVDQIVTAICLSNENSTVNSSVTNVADSDNGVNQVTSGGKLDVVTVMVKGKSGASLPDPVTLGDEIHLIFSMEVNDLSTNRDFQLLQCWANDGTRTPNYRAVTFLTDGCPDSSAKFLFAGLPTKTQLPTKSVEIDVALKAFMFLNSKAVMFVCSVGFCDVYNTGICKQEPCTGYSGTAAQTPIDSGQSNSSSTVPDAPMRRKRGTPATGQVNVMISNLRDPNNNSPSETGKEQPTVDMCINNEDIIAVIAILGVCVFLLMITTIMLIFCMRKSKKKPDLGHSDRFTCPVEAVRFPRLEMHAQHNDGC